MWKCLHDNKYFICIFGKKHEAKHFRNENAMDRNISICFVDLIKIYVSVILPFCLCDGHFDLILFEWKIK